MVRSEARQSQDSSEHHPAWEGGGEMRTKPALRYLSLEHAVYSEVEIHFRFEKKVQLPEEWTALVSLSCFPHMAAKDVLVRYETEPDRTKWTLVLKNEDTKAGETVFVYERPLVTKVDHKTGRPIPIYERERNSEETEAFRTCFAAHPDLTLEIMTYARQVLLDFSQDGSQTKSQTQCVRNFLLKWPSVIRECLSGLQTPARHWSKDG